MLIIVVGNRGSGKTLYLTSVALKSNRIIYSNFELNIDRYRKVEVVDLLDLPDDIELFLDEGYTWLEARTSMKALNRYLSYIAFQLRKRNLNVFLTAQQFSTLDVRYRDEWDMLIKCERIDNGRKRDEWDFKYSILHKESLKTSAWRLPFDKAEDYFDMYNTYEVVEPYDKKKLELQILQDAPELFWAKVEKVGNELEPTLNKITRSSVKVGLLKLGYDKSYCEYVYLYLKDQIK